MSPYCIKIYVSDAGVRVATEPQGEQEEPAGTEVDGIDGALEAVKQIVQNGGAPGEQADAQGDAEYAAGFGGAQQRFP